MGEFHRKSKNSFQNGEVLKKIAKFCGKLESLFNVLLNYEVIGG